MKRIISFFIILLSLFLLFINQDRIIDNYYTLRIELMPDPMAINTYDKGQCTYYVFDKVKKDGNMIERSWRDAKHWAKLAKQDGYNVNHSPRKGALLQSPRGTQGHVA
ncbi:CHAP domain-containing protein [Macrococcus epidermidis]|uniref:CHAP domain-containing protein n=1 Tax=Macrococcus epidermidis TaxID=1902580 RepID=UPI0020B6AD53|nr:CHAP domain-containing protein [Macrococcus epidermidis]